MMILGEIFSFRGRISRTGFVFFLMISLGLAACVGGTATAMWPPGDRPSADETTASLVAACVVLLPWVVAQFSFAVRRLHDMNLSGWICLPLLTAHFVPYGTIVVLAWLAFGLGTKGGNAHGPDPQGPNPPDPRLARFGEVFDGPADGQPPSQR